MESGIYVGISAQIALEQRLTTLSHNMANARTTGFKAEEVRFEHLLSSSATKQIDFVTIGEMHIARHAGPMVHTGNSLDVAVKGDAWFAIDTPQGQVYTRDGRLTITPEGDLTTINGHAILDVGGAPLKISTKAGPISIANDGMISQDGRKVGAIGLFKIDANAKLARYENSGVIPDIPAEPALNFNLAGVRQGYLEQSNVNAVTEMMRLIEVSRAFEAVTQSITNNQNTMKEAIRTLGESS